MQVLIVDDDLALRGMLALTLEQKGYSVQEAASSDQAVEQLKQHKVDVVLLDMGMPPNEHTSEEGLKVLNWCSESSYLAKVIVLTGQDAEATSYQAIKFGAFDFLSKPVSNEKLFHSIERASLFLAQSQKLKEQEGVQKVELDLQMGDGVKNARNAAELKLLKQVLKDTQFNVHEVARRLGLKRENVYYLINKYGINRDSF